MRRLVQRLAVSLTVLMSLCVAAGCTNDNGATAASSAATTQEIEQLIADYRSARGLEGTNDFDRDAFLELVSDEFTETLHMYYEFGGVLRKTGTHSTPIDEFYTMSPWELEQDGVLVVAGDGPWFVSAVEVFFDTRQRYEGTATYVIVDNGGTLTIAEYHWIGVYGERA